MMINNYVPTHLHSTYSINDSTTDPEDYINKAKELGMKAIAFTEHGNAFNWIKKKQLCDKAGIKFLFGIEVYLTKSHEVKERDNYHTIMIAKNHDGIKEILNLLSISTDKEHQYYKNRLSFEEFCNSSRNIITTSACLGSPLAHLDRSDEWFDKLMARYDYLEIQPHSEARQIKYNQYICELASEYNKPIISGADTHEINEYKSECRKIILRSMQGDKYLDDMENFDLTFKSFDELVEMYRKQGVLDEETYMTAINNTNVLADTVEDFELDYTFKYPDIFKDPIPTMISRCYDRLNYLIDTSVIKDENFMNYSDRIDSEVEVFNKLNMGSFMLYFGQLIGWCKENNIEVGPGRGSVTGSLVAYLLGITEVDPIVWGTNFVRFCNVNRYSLGDIDCDFPPADRPRVYKYIREQFGDTNSAYIVTFQKLKVKSIIDSVGRALKMDVSETERIKAGYNDIEREEKSIHKQLENNKISEKEHEELMKEIDKKTYEYMSKFENIFYYFKGLNGAIASTGFHACGIIGSPINVVETIGVRYNKDKDIFIAQCDMKNVDSVNYVKYDILSLKTMQVLRDTFRFAGLDYPDLDKINWKDEEVFKDMMTSPVGLFQMEADSAFQYLCKFNTSSVQDIALVNALIRPSCASFREQAIQKVLNKNPTEEIDAILDDTYGYLIYQEQIILFLQKICGFTEAEADIIRRAIGKKSKALLDEWMPKIEEGYIKMSSKSEDEARKEFEIFSHILINASDYGFSYNHSIAYSMITYLTAYARYYYPKEFISSYLNNASNDDDIKDGIRLAELKGVDVVSPKYGISRGDYIIKNDKVYKGLESVLNVSNIVGEDLYTYAQQNKPNDFLELLDGILALPSTNKTNIETLIKIDFFSEFGSGKKLLKIYELYRELNDRKVLDKEKTSSGIKKIIIRKLKDNEAGFTATAKQYKIVGRKLLEELWRLLPNEEFTILERVTHQLSYLNYIQDRDLIKLKIGLVKFKSKYDSWCVKIGDSDLWYKNMSGTEINRNDLILIDNDTEYKDKKGRMQRILYDVKVIALDRKKRSKE